MKKYYVLSFVFISAFVHGQLPVIPEDISPLLVGEKIPSVSVQTVSGETINSESFYSKGKSILIFYRGGWCPYCNTQMSQLQLIEKDLVNLGYTIYAISPDSPDKMKESVEKIKMTYTLISDKTGTLSRALGIAFKSPEHYEKRLEAIQGVDAELHLPVPSVFIVNTNGEILFEYINPNYKVRMSSDLLLAAAKIFAEKK